jgi:hypothetical protein
MATGPRNINNLSVEEHYYVLVAICITEHGLRVYSVLVFY